MPGEADEANRIAGSEQLMFPNSIAISPHGVVYVSDSLAGEVWAADGFDGTLERWLSDPLVEGTGATLGPEVPIGANGLVWQDDVLYVANTEQASIVRVPVGGDGSAGAAVLWTTDERLAGIDGLSAGPDGVIYAVVNEPNTVYRVSWSTSLTLLADEDDGIDRPSDLDFGKGPYERSAYVVNFSIGELFGETGGAGPSVMRIDHAAPMP
jgi:sugar lactone lactonase YvrE